MKKILAAYIVIALVAIFFASSLFADEPKKYFITLSAPEIAVIGNALAAQPYGQVASVMADLQKQINDQDKPPPAAPESSVKKE